MKWVQWRMGPFLKSFLQQRSLGSRDQVTYITSIKGESLAAMKKSQLLSHFPHCLGHHHNRCQQHEMALIAYRKKVGANGAFPLPELCRIFWSFWQHSKLYKSHHLMVEMSELLRLDNTTAVSYIRKQGGGGTCLSLLWEVEPNMSWAQKNLSNISMGLCFRSLKHANGLSIQLDNEWSVHVEVFDCILTLGISPEVDLCASPCNNKL